MARLHFDLAWQAQEAYWKATQSFGFEAIAEGHLLTIYPTDEMLADDDREFHQKILGEDVLPK